WQQQHAFEDGIATLRHGLERVDSLPFHSGLAEELRGQLRLAEEALRVARRQELVRQLHKHVEDLRLALGMQDLTDKRLRSLEEAARALWERREQIREQLDSSSNVD